MNKPKALKYLSPLAVYLLALLSFAGNGFVCWLALIYAWILIPLTEIFIHEDPSNMLEAEEEVARKNKLYDYILYSIVILQFMALYIFLWQMKNSAYSASDAFARIFTMGLLCGTFGINVGHELGHRVNRFEQFLAKSLLLSSLYMHFFVEHNKGHHKNVATREDPSSARLWESVYAFYFRTIFYSYLNAWRISNNDARKKGKSAFSFSNEMIRMLLIQIAMLVLIELFFGWVVTIHFLAAAAIGILLLETVNYIEHYGLSRSQTKAGKYERTMPHHSWNSDHIIGRLMLFELSRHSDHHYLASRKYQVLRHHDDAPQMPTGYPGMMILSLIPPLWFFIMHRQMRKFNLPFLTQKRSKLRNQAA